MSDIIQSLWIGGELSNMEQLSAKSFIDHGHTYHLYTYGDVKNIPEGIIVKDGNEILPESEIFRYKNGSVSAFSNLFRFELLYKKGGCWADTDFICVSDKKFQEPYVISTEPSLDYKHNVITSSFIKMPKSSEAAKTGVTIQRKIKADILSGRIHWGAGPRTVKLVVQMLSLEQYIVPWQTTCSCSYNDAASLVIPKKQFHTKVIKHIEDIPSTMFGIHMWNECWRTAQARFKIKMEKNGKYDSDSLYEQLKKSIK